ncbi:hypothetical protein GCM10022254_04520 [Actinomadura meridiana]|uniref:Secreted protein n=1 Tax=Actinomadura meridiana TaxID=559626 RepID=A0ABP8BS95_9ACTN
MLGGLLLVRVGRLAVGRLAALRRRGRATVLLLASVLRLTTVLRLASVLRAPLLGALGRREAPVLVVESALGTARPGQVGPAAHAEQIALLERFVTDRTVQGRHDTSPERTPAR